jgi:diaminohydroxyphosphoribosylaminopyrimidine deaminase/5-amino-6-(5-phosphoribosylamino)uracil reductase
MKDDSAWMRLAIREAKKGRGRTAPNPCVGAVIVQEGRMLAKGWHRRAGTPHAEIHALRAAGPAAAGATLYVTLEPCNHHGRTPPCTEAILAAGIGRVVVGMQDPNPVAGGGVDRLASQGLAVTCGVLAEECRRLNRPFSKHISTGLPWVTIKAGISLDGRIAARTGHSRWITGPAARLVAHHLRDRHDAVLVGVGTVLADDPSLTTRLPGGRGRDPLRVVLDSRLRTPVGAKMLIQESAAATWIFHGPEADPAAAQALQRAGAALHQVGRAAEGGLDVREVLQTLGRAGILSVLAEGGGMVHGALLRAGLADAAALFVAPILIGGDGLPLLDILGLDRVEAAPRLREVAHRRLGEDLLIEGIF